MTARPQQPVPRRPGSMRLMLAGGALTAIALVALALIGPAVPDRSHRDPPPAVEVKGERSAGSHEPYMLVEAARLRSLPTSGTAWARLKHTADDALGHFDLGEPASPRSPWLPDYADSRTGIGKASATLAAALVYARTGDERYRDFVVRVCRFVIGSEDGASTNGTDRRDIALATMRQISGYVLAADLVGMDRGVTGSRAGYGDTRWGDWLAALRTKPIAPSGYRSIVDNNARASNWGAWASAARITIDVYLDDRSDLAAAVGRLKLYLGETTSGTWDKSRDFDASWACVPAGADVDFVPVTPSSCGPAKDGVIVEDASRSSSSFPHWDDTGIDYSFHAFQAQLGAAIVLDRQGYDVWDWGDRAFKRIMDQFHRLGVATGNGRLQSTLVAWIPRYFYGVRYPTAPAHPGETLVGTDWLYGQAAFTLGAVRRSRGGTAVLVARVPGRGRLTLSGDGLRGSTRRTLRAGALELRVRPNARTRARLRAHGRAAVRVTLRFASPVQRPQTRVKTVVLVAR